MVSNTLIRRIDSCKRLREKFENENFAGFIPHSQKVIKCNESCNESSIVETKIIGFDILNLK